MIISLIGYRGTGKTTIGQLLADRLGWTCADTDLEIQQRWGHSIRSIFQQEGEERFRQYERDVILQLTRRHKLVLSLGGGAILLEANRQAIALAGPVVWLEASPSTIRQRLSADPGTAETRPSLTGRSAVDEIEQILRHREPIYESCADLRVQTEDLSPGHIVDRIMSALDLSPETGLS